MRVWRLLPQHTDLPGPLLAAAGGRRMLARLLLQRGHTSPEDVTAFLDPDRYRPAPPAALPGLEDGVARIESALANGERILVWGDFDVDGQTSTALFVSALQALGGDVAYHIPVRAVESHGVRPDVLQTYLDAGIDLLLTCDTGIAAVEAVARANDAGVDTVVTDHHDLPATLPDAVALVNPKFLHPRHPLAALPGVGVVYKVVQALYERAGRADELEAFLDLVALGIVADLATLAGDTRYLLQRGLEILRRTERVGLRALMDRAGIVPAALGEEDIGFGIGPRLNAVGRLADANVSVPLLTTGDREAAERIADTLERLNEERKVLTDQVYSAARGQIDRDPTLAQYAALVLAHPHWHQGVIGIVASRLVDDFGKPVILLASPEGAPARGSARSVEGYNITEAIASQAKILHGFGGHPMAAGLAIDADRIDRFRVGVSTALSRQRDGTPPDPVLEIALKLDLAALTEEVVAEIEAAGPFGPGNPPVNVLCTGLEPVAVRTIGKTARHRKVTVRGRDSDERDVLWWNSMDASAPEEPIDLVLRARTGYFRGERSLSLTWQDHRLAGGEAARMRPAGLQITDLRASSTIAERDALIVRHPDAVVWGEGAPAVPQMRGRHQAEPADDLIVWTCPPQQAVVDALLARVRPLRVHVVAADPGCDSVAAFRKRLAGLVRYAMEARGGAATLVQLAAAMASTELAVREGLSTLCVLGVRADIGADGSVRLVRAAPSGEGDLGTLAALLEEIQAYRRLFRNTSHLDALLDRQA